MLVERSNATHSHFRRVNRIFLVLTITALAISSVAVVAQWSTVASKHRLVETYEKTAREVERVHMLSERRARKLRMSVLFGKSTDEADLRTTRAALRGKVEALARGRRRQALEPPLDVVRDLDSPLSAAEDRLIALVHSGATRAELGRLMSEEVMPLRDEFDEAILGLGHTADRLLASARADSQRTDTMAIGALSVTVGIALVAIVALLLQLRAVLRQLRSTRGQLEEITKFQQYLMGMVGHDIRSPLSAILLAASTMPGADSDPIAFERSRARIMRNASRIERMAGMLMDVTRMQAGLGIPISTHDSDLHEVVGHVVEEVRASAGRVVEHRQLGDGHGELDDDRLVQVVTNLLNNAITYSPPTSPVEVVTVGTSDELAVEVHNEGTIAPDLLPRIFEPFTRGVRARGSEVNVGLGLYVARRLTEALRGRIEVRSTKEEGTTFHVTLPRRWAAGPAG